MTDPPRERNRRGEGSRLRAEILAAATELLEQTGSEEAVTLRAIARRVGISAPSIYAHFDGREAIVNTIVDDAFRDLTAAIDEAVAAAADPLGRLRAGGAAYVSFAAARPNRYRLLFERRHLVSEHGAARPARTDAFARLTGALQDCIDADVSASDDPHRDATAIWVALHGYATLHALVPGFRWPDQGALLERMVDGLAQVRQ